MQGYGEDTYGDAFADVYDDWYLGISDVDATVGALVELAGAGTAVLELAVGTGRLAIPLAERGVQVHGVDTSAAMLDRLAAKDAAGLVTTSLGDMVDDLPPGPFALAFVAYNSFFALRTAERQRQCFAAVAERLQPGGAFVIEAFVPEPRPGSDISVRTLTADRVVLSISRHDDADQVAEGQFVEITEAGGVRLRPWAIRWSTPAQLDAMAAASGLTLAARWEDFCRAAFDEHSVRHVSTYRRAADHTDQRFPSV